MTDRVTIVDLGLGNLHSVARAFERVGAAPTIASDPDAIRGAERLVVPGQGAFRECAEALVAGLGDALREAIAAGTPYLGICLGMQVLFADSEEAPGARGLGIFPGRVVRFRHDLTARDGTRLKVPHMGWNQVSGRHPLVEDGGWYYFVHSYYCVPDDDALVAGTATYGEPFCAAIARDNVFACQFHPEKSQARGATLVERFLRGGYAEAG